MASWRALPIVRRDLRSASYIPRQLHPCRWIHIMNRHCQLTSWARASLAPFPHESGLPKVPDLVWLRQTASNFMQSDLTEEG